MKKSHIEYLHLFTLVSFAVAQPIYDLLGKNPEFFVAHANKPADIIYMILVLSFGLSFALVMFELFARLFSKRFRIVVHYFFVFSLTVLIALPLMKQITSSDSLIVVFAVLFGIFFTVLYVHLHLVSMFLSMLLPVTLIFPLIFIYATPVGRLVAPTKNQTHAKIQIRNPVTTIVLVFDEFSTTALLDRKGSIDPVRFPNFPSLAAESLWFPNAVTASQSTVEAIPSIVTGLNPHPEMKLMPTAKDYPDNLFTLLGGRYSMYVSETCTALCPQEFCMQQNSKAGDKYSTFISDIFIIYVHILAPPERAKTLPSVDMRWAGFGNKHLSTQQVSKNSPNALYAVNEEIKKEDQLSQFLSRIKVSSIPKLYFIHTELPHVPYWFLASGQRYSAENNCPEGIISEEAGWIGSKPLIITAYNRYLQQIGYVDNFLGKVRDNLISKGIYDNSLLILTADHGVAFEPWQSRRLMTGINNSEILKIPMFVKLPNQKKGRIDNRIASGIDILPTIIDVLKIEVPWKLDGLSMVKNNGPNREEIEIVGLGRIGKNDIAGFTRLEWQINQFGEHTPLDRLVPKGLFNELIEHEVNSLRFGEATNLVLISDTFGFLQYVDLGSQFLPSLFRGYVEGTDKSNLPLAVAVNDKIWATTKTSEWEGKINFFSILLPTSAFRQGQNFIDVYLIEESPKGLLLRPINLNQKYVKLKQTQANEDTLIFKDGKEFIVETGRNSMDGYLDRLIVEEGMLVFEGWAADLIENQPASNVLIFKGEKLLWQTTPTYSREDVVKALNRPTLFRSGYRAIVPLMALESNPGDISVIAISEDKRAFRIHIKDIHKELIRTTLSK